MNTPRASGYFRTAYVEDVRLLDTRPGQPACATPGTPLDGGASATIGARGTCDGVAIPASARAVVGNATVVSPANGRSGYVTLYPLAGSRPTVSNLNYVGGQVVPNAFTIGVAADGTFQAYAYSAIDFVVDLTGYFSPEATDTNSATVMLGYQPRYGR